MSWFKDNRLDVSVWQCLSDSESYVRSTSIDCLTDILLCHTIRDHLQNSIPIDLVSDIPALYCKKKVSTVMVNNSTNINKTNNHLSLQINTVNIKKTMTYDVGNPGPGLKLAQKCGEVKLVNVCLQA
jgi:hypothetical protein